MPKLSNRNSLLATTEPTSDSSTERPMPGTLKPNTCLIVDASKLSRIVARKQLDGLGMELAEVPCGAAALSYCRYSMPAFIFLDWRLPDTASLTVLARIRALPGGHLPYIVFCSTDPEAGKLAPIFGADDVVGKPYRQNQMRAALSASGAV